MEEVSINIEKKKEINPSLGLTIAYVVKDTLLNNLQKIRAIARYSLKCYYRKRFAKSNVWYVFMCSKETPYALPACSTRS